MEQKIPGIFLYLFFGMGTFLKAEESNKLLFGLFFFAFKDNLTFIPIFFSSCVFQD